MPASCRLSIHVLIRVQWHLHRDDERYLGFLMERGMEVEDAGTRRHGGVEDRSRLCPWRHRHRLAAGCSCLPAGRRVVESDISLPSPLSENKNRRFFNPWGRAHESGSLAAEKRRKPEFTDIAINTSIATLPVPMIWGRAAGGINLLWYGNFQAIRAETKRRQRRWQRLLCAGNEGVDAARPAIHRGTASAAMPSGASIPKPGKKVKGRVKLTHKHDVANDSHDRMLRIHHEDGVLHVTENHYLWKDGIEKIEAKDWQVGDLLVHEELAAVTISRGRSVARYRLHLQSTIEPHHNYFADGVLVHNGGGSKTGSYDYQTGLILRHLLRPHQRLRQYLERQRSIWQSRRLGTYRHISAPRRKRHGAGWYPYNASQALNYRYIAYLCSANFDLGSNDALPQLKVETYRRAL